MSAGELKPARTLEGVIEQVRAHLRYLRYQHPDKPRSYRQVAFELGYFWQGLIEQAMLEECARPGSLIASAPAEETDIFSATHFLYIGTPAEQATETARVEAARACEQAKQYMRERVASVVNGDRARSWSMKDVARVLTDEDGGVAVSVPVVREAVKALVRARLLRADGAWHVRAAVVPHIGRHFVVWNEGGRQYRCTECRLEFNSPNPFTTIACQPPK